MKARNRNMSKGPKYPDDKLSRWPLIILSAFSIGFFSTPSFPGDRRCEDPVASVLGTLSCIENRNAFCAASGYASNFAKYHNGVNTKTGALGAWFWLMTFYLVDFHLEFDHVALVGDNQVSLRYIETVTFRDGGAFKQHEHALVTVDDNCRITLWDQYGDNKEQQDVIDKLHSLRPFYWPE
jgi:hypothetical protein